MKAPGIIIAAMLASFLSAAALADPVYYGDRGAFDAANPGLLFEDFEALNVGVGGVTACTNPGEGLNSATNTACAPTGSVIDGFTVIESGGAGLAAIGAGFSNAPSKQIVANTFVESFNLLLNVAVSAVGFDVVTHFNNDLEVLISIFGANDALLGTRTVAGTNAGTFFGISDNMNLITRINIFSRSNQAEGIDNLSFGLVRDTAQVPEPGTLALLGLGLAGIGLTRRRKKV